MPAVLGGRDRDLRPPEIAVAQHEREESVRRAAGDELELSLSLQPLQRAQETVIIQLHEIFPGPFEQLEIAEGERLKLRHRLGALDLFARELDQTIDVAHEARL